MGGYTGLGSLTPPLSPPPPPLPPPLLEDCGGVLPFSLAPGATPAGLLWTAAAAVRDAWCASNVTLTGLMPCSAAHCDHSCSGRFTGEGEGAEGVRPPPRLYSWESAGGKVPNPLTPDPSPGPSVLLGYEGGAMEVVA